jgi:hypothetical protein
MPLSSRTTGRITGSAYGTRHRTMRCRTSAAAANSPASLNRLGGREPEVLSATWM